MKKDYFTKVTILLLLLGFSLSEMQAQDLPNLKNPTNLSDYSGTIGRIEGNGSTPGGYVNGLIYWTGDVIGTELEDCESVERIRYGNDGADVTQRGLPGGEYYKRFEIVSQGLDPNTCSQLSTTPPDTSFTHAIRVGNSMNSEAERLHYDFEVTQENNLFSFWFAVVLEDPYHGEELNPQVNISMKILNDGEWKLLDSSLHYTMISSRQAQEEWGTESCPGKDGIDIMYKPWTNVVVGLNDHIGETVRLEIINRDCLPTGHFAYCYFAGEFLTLEMEKVEYNKEASESDTIVFIEAQAGFDEYQWYVTDSNTKAEKVAIQGERGKLQRLPVLEEDFMLYSKKGAKLQFECELISYMNPEVPNKSFVSVEVLNRKPYVDIETAFEDNYTINFTNESFLRIDEDIDRIDESKTRWDMGEGTIYTQHSDITHRYETPGIKEITVYIETREGYKSQKVFSATVGGTSSIDTPDKNIVSLKRSGNNYEIALANEKTIKQIEIYDVSSRLHKILLLNDKKGTFKIEKSGIFLVKIITTDGQSIFEKIANF